MIRAVFPTAFLLLAAVSWLSAQTPVNIKITDAPAGWNRVPCSNADAGTIAGFGPFVGESNDTDPDLIYLCMGDTLRVDHAGDFVLNGDPNNATTPGIAYVFYDDMPTVDGPDLDAVLADPSLNTTSPIVVNGMNFSQINGIWVSPSINGQGDLDLINNGSLQSAYNGGIPEPIQFWFAPITVDNGAGTGNMYFENGGPCVSVAIDEAFSVVYLEAITVAEELPNAGPSLQGALIVEGGLPEFDPAATYTVSIQNAAGTLAGTVLTPNAGHGDTLRYEVPAHGEYEVVIEDGKSCSFSTVINMPVLFDVGDVNGPPGDTVCVPIVVQNFVDLTNVQFSMAWDPALLDFVRVDNLTGNLPSFDTGSFNTSPSVTDTGRLTMGWLNFLGDPISLADGEVMFEVCFEILGDIGDQAGVSIVDDPSIIQVGNASTGQSDLPVDTEPGSVIVTPNALLVQSFAEDETCDGDNDGSFTVAISGGAAPYLYSWNELNDTDPPTTGTVAAGDSLIVNGLSPNDYVVTITDNEVPANTVIDTITIGAGLNLGVNIEVFTPPTCAGDADGALIAVVIENGVTNNNADGLYNFTWSIADSTRQVLSGIAPGSYAVTVTTLDGECMNSDNGFLGGPAVLELPGQNETPPDPNLTVNSPTCLGAEDGDISAMATGGSTFAGGEYIYTWVGLGLPPDTAATAQLADINPGTYQLAVLDANGCTDTATYNITPDKTLLINLVDSSHVSCNSLSDAFIQVNGSSQGQAPFGAFTYSWEEVDGAQTFNTPLIQNLGAGQYALTITDMDPLGCFAVDTFDIGQPDSLLVGLTNLQNESCQVGNDGAIAVAANGGTAPYQYNWSNMSTDSSLTMLSEGVFFLTVTDGNNCEVIDTFAVTAPTPPTIVSFEDDTLACNGDANGSLTINAVPAPGGAPISGYAWSNNATGPTINGLAAGQYIVTITSADGCVFSDTAFVLEPAPLAIDSVNSNLPLCVGQSNGSLAVFASGGTAPYQYIWGNTPENDTLATVLYPGLAAGTYNLTVTDANGCAPAVASVVLEDPADIDIAFSDVQQVSCFEGVCDGQATAAAIYEDGTTGLFNFSWESGEVTLDVMSATAVQLCRDSQTVVVTDQNGCVATAEVFIPSPDPIEINVDVSNVSCAGEEDGTAMAMPSGGTGLFTFSWPDLGEDAAAVSGLASGLYTIVVTDANGCEQDQLVEITEPDPLVLSIDPNNTQDVSCFGLEDGQVAVTYNFNDNINPVGANPFTFSANVPPGAGSPSTGFANGLAAGTYGITITDVRGCRDSVSVTLTSPPEIMAVIPDPEDPLCFDATTLVFIDTVFGGVGTVLDDYRYMVDGNGVLLPPDIPADIFGDGEHTVEIFDPNGCSAVYFVDIDQPEEILVTFPESFIEVELGDSTTRLQPIITPVGTVIDSFIWTPADYLSSDTVGAPIVFPLESLEYTLQVVDENGCTAFGSIFVELDANRNIYIPNAFSPNGDGINDEFRVYPCTGVTAINNVSIYDRWGNQVFQRSGIDVRSGQFCSGGLPLWEGDARGEDMNKGVFVYVIQVEFLDGVRLTYRGDVSILK